MTTLIEDFADAIENNKLIISEALFETGLELVKCANFVNHCELCGKSHPDDNLYHLFGFNKKTKKYTCIYAHYICILDFLKKV